VQRKDGGGVVRSEHDGGATGGWVTGRSGLGGSRNWGSARHPQPARGARVTGRGGTMPAGARSRRC
jgi:hypothetical protein